ncbi:unnamed protein product [Arctia plantaginis]|uniref:Uncharacterized protein n=1 Tax=Arctia plantaginis TaxID=874455 RepID=A0A8S0ZW83_ARCPL|nr:unnamed protein product [Arctia plantaginis]CAB3237913.1 unnamed protein product [Arctia plantaginis]
MERLEDLNLKKCCFCIELKLACYIISILSIVILVPGTSGAVEHCYEGTAPIRIIQGLGAFMFLLALFAGIFFIYGLCTEVRLPTMTFMVAVLIAVVVTFITAILVLTQQPNKKSCPDSIALAGSALIEIAVQIYCFVIVNSYRVLAE